MNWQQLWLGLLLPITVSGRALGPAEEKAAVDYLLQYGYLQKPLEVPDDFSPEDIMEALRAFQEASELPVSGQLDEATKARMRQPRCGLEDPFNQKTLKYLLLGRWRKKHLTFRILNLPSSISSYKARAALLQAFRYWSNVAPLTFREVQAGWADIRLSFHGRQSPTCSNTFDGPGKKTPETEDEEEETEVPIVSPVPTEPGPMPNPCSSELDAMMLGPHGKTYAFKGDYVWTVTNTGLGPLFRISALWEGLPGNLDAAVYSPRTQWIHFFKGNKVWRYINFKMSPGFPKKLNRVEPNLDAALYWPLNQKVFLFKGSGYWQWDELAQTDFSRYPKPIKELFTGVPDQPSAAMSWRDGRVYFFKGKEYWRLNRQLRVEKGYPQNIAHNWMHCRPQTPVTNPSFGATASSTTGTTLESTPSAMAPTLNHEHSPTDSIVDTILSATDSTSLSFPANVTRQET
ncbi:matrix metalloproteinase-19 isoform X2 [Dipodomys merriami]|uniref:matrix metalloproteinase-19 isoform X2 n=1 Tax=Dipodomys merriami TaxID=94247 RepID=UPI00384BC09E